MRCALALLAAFPFVDACTSNPGTASPPERPNIVLIVADDLGYGDLGCYGQRITPTPNLDAMASDGMRFTQFYAGSTVCAPSRCVLMTGKQVGRAFIRGNGKLDLLPEHVTVAEVLAESGYRTGLFGKWGLGHEGSTGTPTKQGFDEFYGYLDQHHAHNYYPSFLVRGEERVALRNVVPNEGRFGQGVASEKVDYSHDLIFDAALDFVDRNHAAPFLLYLALTLPHANNEAGKQGMEIPDYGEFADASWPSPQKGLAAMIARMDRDVGRLLDELRAHGIDDHTIVLFTSDNGPHREGGNDPDFQDSNGPLRGIKRSLHDGGIRVPLIAWAPGFVPAGRTSSHIAYFGDFMATAAELAGAECPADCDSLSFVPALAGDAAHQRAHPYLYWEFYEGGSAQAVRLGRYKAVRAPMFTGEIELYDLEKDIGEQTDVADLHPDVVARVAEVMAECHEPSERWKVRARR